MAALLVMIGAMGVLMSAALPSYRHAAQREREAELIFRGEQYARAVGLYQRQYAGAFPPSIEVLIEQRFLRKVYTDPMTPDGEFELLFQTSAVGAPGATPGTPAGGDDSASIGRGQPSSAFSPPPATTGSSTTTAGARGGIVGVVSRSEDTSIREYNGRTKYNEWQFVYTEIANQVGGPGAATPGQPVGPGGAPGTGPGGPMTPAGPGRPGTFGPSGAGPGGPVTPGVVGPEGRPLDARPGRGRRP